MMAKIKRSPKEKKIMELKRKMNDESLSLGDRKKAVTEFKNLTVKFCTMCGKEIYGNNYYPFYDGDSDEDELPICQTCKESIT